MPVTFGSVQVIPAASPAPASAGAAPASTAGASKAPPDPQDLVSILRHLHARGARLRAHWTKDRVILVVVGIVCFYVIYVTYRNLKSFLPLVSSRHYDRELHMLDRVLFFGHEPSTIIHALLGTVELEEGQVDDAIATLGRALELHPDYHAARVLLARALEASGDRAQAEEQVTLVLDADPQNPAALELAERWSRLHRRRDRSATRARKAS